MICRVGRRRWRGRAIDLPVDVRPAVLARAVRGADLRDRGRRVSVVAPVPDPVHRRIGHVHPELSVRVKTALAAAARTRGLSAPRDERLAEARRELANAAGPAPDPVSRSAVDDDEEVAGLQEAVAAARGRLAVHREHDIDPAAASERLEAAIRSLTDAETERIEARQRRERTRRANRADRDRLERRMALRDELHNLERRNRAALVERVRPHYESALAALPSPRDASDPFAVDDVTAALAIARVADLSTPVVLAADRFETADAAAAYLGSPVLRVGV